MPVPHVPSSLFSPMLVIPSKIFILLVAALIAMAIFPDRIRNKAAYRRAVIACMTVFGVHAIGLGILSIVGMPFLDLVEIRRPEDLAQLSWVGILMAASWGAVGVGYWSAFRAALDLAPLRKTAARSTRGRSHTRSRTTTNGAKAGHVTENNR